MVLTTLSPDKTTIQIIEGSQHTTRPWYYERANDSDVLTIAVGDSWTWGDSLGKTTPEYDDFDHRVNHIYGNLIAKKLNSDFINIGLPGRSNLYILTFLDQVLNSLVKTYKTIRVFFTLTESGRELEYGFLEQVHHYEQWRGPDWPSHQEIVNGTAQPNALSLMFQDIGNEHFGSVIRMYLKLRSANSLIELLELYEQVTFQEIKNYFDRCPSNVKWTIGRNFTCMFEANKSIIPAECLVEETWVDVIATQGKLPPYPQHIYLLSSIGIGPLVKFSEHLDKEKFKANWINLLEIAESGIDWLDMSPYNSNLATRHPLEQAHAWWAEHLYKRIANE